MRVVGLEVAEEWKLHCMFDNGAVRVFYARPLIERHLHIEGVAGLLTPEGFKRAVVGTLGQV